ncbi:hypothetical protein NLG97_g9563 [Lecanicillium saksenae]|uniref:Uncharacterized protein n=1 Tax=Lecanicillium saksenae TaxID=468837 RepID=A0ACC1QHP0_9HYPO|nr:hypothetical protein NLG97_g9563 [Lecanicillium saksenae]
MSITEKGASSTRVPQRKGSDTPLLPIAKSPVKKHGPRIVIHPAIYVVTWLSISSLVIIFNKWIVDTLNFRYPVILTTYHQLFATVVTQILARCTSYLDGRKDLKMTPFLYIRAVAPIGVVYSASLMCGNLAYLHLSVAFIQMLKATMPMAVLVAGWALGVTNTSWKQFINVSIIVVGVVIASLGEIDFVLIGFVLQLGGVIFEALRLTMVQRFLNSADFRMDPLVSVYYFAPVCAVLNAVVAIFWELPKVTMDDVYHVGFPIFFFNGFCAFMLNVSVVLLIGKTSAVVLTISGVLKDILLVVASIMIWDTQVTPLQTFGYAGSLLGMIYYKLGYAQIKDQVAELQRYWAGLGSERIILQRLSAIFMAIVFCIFLLVLLRRYEGYRLKP